MPDRIEHCRSGLCPLGRVWRVGAVLGLLWLAAAAPAFGQNIVIFRPEGNDATEVKQPDIVFEVQVSAFAPIRSVQVNGQDVPVGQATWVSIKRPYRLHPGENRFVVDATTEFGTARQEFVINLKVQGAKAKKAAKSPFLLIGMLGAQHISNVLKVPENTEPVAGTRRFLILIPRYDFGAGSNSKLRLQSILSRDSYGDDALAEQEVAFTQLTLSWINGDPKQSTWTLGLGYNYIDATFDTLLKGKTHTEDDSFVFGEYQHAFGKTGSWTAGLEYKNQNLKEEAANPDAEEDARVGTLSASVVSGLVAALRGKLKLGYTVNDAVGKLKDQTISRAAGELAYPLGSFIPSIGVRYRQTTFAEVDPVLEAALETKLTTAVLTVNYQITDALVLLLEYLSEKQAANVPSQEYTSTASMASLVFIY